MATEVPLRAEPVIEIKCCRGLPPVHVHAVASTFRVKVQVRVSCENLHPWRILGARRTEKAQDDTNHDHDVAHLRRLQGLESSPRLAMHVSVLSNAESKWLVGCDLQT